MTRSIRKYQKYLNGGFFANPDSDTSDFTVTETETETFPEITPDPKTLEFSEVSFDSNSEYDPYLIVPDQQLLNTIPMNNGRSNKFTPNGSFVPPNGSFVPPNGSFFPPQVNFGTGNVANNSVRAAGYKKYGHHYPKYISGSGYRHGASHGRSYLSGGYAVHEDTTVTTETLTVTEPSSLVSDPTETATDTFTETATETIPETLTETQRLSEYISPVATSNGKSNLKLFSSPYQNVQPADPARAAQEVQQQLQESINVLKKMVTDTQKSISKNTANIATSGKVVNSRNKVFHEETSTHSEPLSASETEPHNKRVEGSGRRHYAHGRKPARHCGNSRYYGSNLSFDL